MNKRSYKPNSPLVEAAITLLERSSAMFNNFGTLDDKVARISFKPQWKRDARAMFEHGAVTKAYRFEALVGYGRPHSVKFYVEFKAVRLPWKSGTALATPSVTITIDSEDELRKIAENIREDRKQRRALTSASRITDRSSREGTL